jgi:hypothetical protein
MQKRLASVFILTLCLVAIGHASAAAAPDRAVRRRRQDQSRATVSKCPAGGLGSTIPRSRQPSEVHGDERRTARDDRTQHHLLGSAADGLGDYTVKRRSRSPSNRVTRCPRVVHRGSDLDTDKQKYSYFLIRENGQYLVKKRDGASTSNVAGDWAPNPAITALSGGNQKNELSLQVSKERVSFLVNGKEVAGHPATSIDTSGVVGLRIGHGMDIQIDGFAGRHRSRPQRLPRFRGS